MVSFCYVTIKCGVKCCFSETHLIPEKQNELKDFGFFWCISGMLALYHGNFIETLYISLGVRLSKSFVYYFGNIRTLFVDVSTRFTSVRVTAKYHGIKLDYREHRHTVLDLLGQIKTKLRLWKRPYISPEAVRLLLQEWHVSSF